MRTINLLLEWFVKSVLWLRYAIKVRGLAKISSRGRSGILFLPNHPALIDPIIVQSVLLRRFRPRALADRDQVDRFFIRNLARHAGVLEIPDLAKYGADSREQVEQVLRKCIDSLGGGQNLLLYPSGHTYSSRYEDLRGNSAVETILRELPDVRVVLVRTSGLWGSSFSRSRGRTPDVGKIIRRGVMQIIANGILFSPRRKVTIEFVEPDDLPRTAGREALNSYMEDFYNTNAPANTYVPYTVWERRAAREMPEPDVGASRGAVDNVPEATRKIVIDHLRELTGIERIDPADSLGRDLGLDSLSRAELLVWLEKEFGFAAGDVDGMQSVADVLGLACGESANTARTELKPVAPKWFARVQTDQPVQPAPGATICEAFLHHAIRNPRRVIIADQTGGVKTYRDVLTAIFALTGSIAQIAGDNVGIMLPASVTADVIYLATLFAGKTPVMVNWTVGPRNMTHCLDLAGVSAVLTARALVSKLAAQGVDSGAAKERFVFLEDIAQGLSRMTKLRAFLRARFMPRSLLLTVTSPTAAILFTSGSESLPKAVPLSHENILTNVRDVCQSVTIFRGDSLIGILPPFHSFGLTTGVVLPLVLNIPIVHYPNPTEGPMLAAMMEAYRPSVLIGTPTFLAGIVRAAGADQMASLRLAVTGAEKCPRRTYEALGLKCRNAVILEGYGVTECSPIISVNRPDSPRPGTIGCVLESLEYAIVNPDTLLRAESGHSGMLLVRGPSVFAGYLNARADTASPFVQFEGQQWYRTGDLVVAGADGVLTFSGRLKRFVKIAGEMISLPAVEGVLAEHYADDSDDGPVLAVEATGGEAHPELVLFTVKNLDRQEVNSLIRREGLSALYNIRRIVILDEIPLLGTGKTDYRTLGRMLLTD